MTTPQAVLVALVGLSTLWALVHLVLVARAFARGARRPIEIVGLAIPPTAPIVAMRRGERLLPVAWAVLLVAYGGVLVFGAL